MTKLFTPTVTMTRRIIGPYILLVLGSNLVLLSLMMQRLDEQLLNQEQQSLTRSTQLQEVRMRDSIDSLRASTRMLAAMPPIQGLLHSRELAGDGGGGGEAWRRQLEAIFVAQLRSTPEIFQARLLLADGWEYVRVDRYGQDNSIRIVPRQGMQDKSARPYFSRAAALGPGELYLSPIGLNREYGEIVLPHEPVVRAATPIHDQAGQLFAVLVVNLNLRETFARVRQVVEPGQQFYIADGDGNYIQHPDADQSFSFEYGIIRRIGSDFSEADALLAGDDDTVVGFLAGGSDGHVYALRVFRYGNVMPDNRMLLATVSSYAQATQIRETLLGKVYLFLGLVLIIASLFAFGVARKIGGPITAMRNAVWDKGLETRREDLPLEVGGEVAELARTFDQLLNAFRARQRQLEREVQHRIEAQANLQRKNDRLKFANRESEQFVYIASHDLQEPLRTIRSFVELLRGGYAGSLDDQGLQFLEFIEKSSQRMEELVKGLLDYSRLGKSTRLEQIDLNDLVRDVGEDLGHRISDNDASIEIGELPRLRGYKTELRLLFQNLIANGIKFARPGVAPRIHIRAKRVDDSWEVQVQDNGIGMPPEHYDRIFLIFQRLHAREDYEGSGIGLAHCKKVVELHGGKIWLQSQPGQGTTFFFTLRGNLSEDLEEDFAG